MIIHFASISDKKDIYMHRTLNCNYNASCIYILNHKERLLVIVTAQNGYSLRPAAPLPIKKVLCDN